MDPRRKPENKTSYLKTAGLGAAIAISGISFHRRTLTNRETILSTIQHSIDKMEKFSPSLSLSKQEMRDRMIREFRESYETPPEYRKYRFSEEWENRKKDLELEFGDDIDIKSLVEYGDYIPESIDDIINANLNKLQVDIHKLQERIDNINHQVLFPDETSKTAADKMAGVDLEGSTDRTLKSLEKEYPGIIAAFDSMDISRGGTEFKIKNARVLGMNYIIDITDGKKSQRVSIPQLESGMAFWKGYPMKPSIPASLKNGIVDAQEMGKLIVEKMHDNSKFTGTKKLFQVAKAIENSVSIYLNGGLGVSTVHELTSMTTHQFHISKFQNMADDALTSGKLNVRKDLNEVYPRLISTSNISIREHLKRPHLSYKGDSRGLSEVSAQKFRYRSELAVGVYPGTRYDKVSQARGNFMPGPLIRGRKGIRTDTYLPSRLGPMSVDVIDHMNKHMMSEIPGGMTNVMFIKSNRDMSFSGTGSGMFIERTGIDGMSNITKYTGSGRRSYTIPILTTQNDGIKVNTGYNTAIDKLISDFESNKNMKLRAGEVIGKSRIFDGKKIERDAKVWHMEIKNNHLVIYVEEEIGLHVGSKFDQNKLMISNITDSAKINAMASREKRTGSRSVMSRLLQDKHAIPLSVDFVTEIDSHSKFTGGQMGMGLIQKVIKDISILEGSRIKSASHQNMFREIMTEMIGPDVDKLIETIKIDKKTLDPAVILKRNPGGDPITTAHAGFSGLLDLESAMKDAIEFNDLRRLKIYQKKINRVFKKYGTIQYRLLEENASNVINMGYIPAFVSGIDGNPNSLGMTITAPMAQHEISAYTYTKTSSMDRNSRGWGNTFRSTLDHYENSYAGGTDKFTKYMDSILGYNNSYILDKMFATEGKTFSNETELAKEFAEKKPGSKRRSSFKNFTKHEIINLEKEGLLDRLASYSFESQSMKVAGKFRVLEKDVSGLQGMVSDETMAKMINNELIDIEDIRDTTRTGMGRFSVDVTDKKLFSDIVDLMVEKSGQDDTAFYLDLGKKAEDIGVMINGRKSRFIPIHKFDATDVFELQGAMSVEGKMTNYTQKYVTGSMYHSNQMALLKRAAEFIKVINDEATDEKKGRQAAKALELAVNDYHKGLVKASKGKHSPLLDKMFETHMPFSMRSILNFAPSTTSTNLTASESAALDSVYLHSDDAIKLITNNRVTSVAGAKSFVENMNTAKKDLEYLKKYMNISGEDVIAASTDDIVKASLSLDKMFKNIDMSALDKDTSSNLHKLRTALDPGGRGSLEDRIRKMSSSQKEQIMELHTTIRNSLMVENIHDQSPLRKVSEIYQYAINTIEEMKAGKVNIMGKLVGSPELSPLSMDYLNVKLIDNDKVSGLDLVNVSGKRLGDSAARIYTSKETAKRISRDFDADPIGFLVTTFDVLEEQANKINGFSILKEAGLEHLKGGDLTRNLTHESIAHTILGRLLQIKDETGADLLKLKPASLTSVTMASLLSEVGNQNNILKSSLDGKIKEYVDSIYSHLNQADRERTYRSVKNIVMDQVHAMKGNEIKVEHLAVVEKILYQRDMDLDTKDIKTKGQAHAEASKEPGRIEKFYLDTLDDIDIDARDKILEINKESYANFRENMIKKSERFKLIKEATPEAYGLTKGLITMSQYYSLGDRERMFMVAYADKIIAQNTISSKHGTPQILPNLKKLIRDMSNPDSTVSETAIERMVTGNLHVQLDKNVVEEIKRSGKADILRDIDINTYSKYLKEKEEYLSELAKVHNVTTKEIYEKKITNKIMDNQLEKEYNSLFNVNLANNKVLSSMHKYDPVTGSISGLQPMYMSQRYVADEFAKNAEAIKAVGKIKSTITDFTEFFTNGTKEQGMDLVRSVQTSLRLYSRMNNVRSVIDDPNIKLFRSFDGPKVTNMFELYDAMCGKIGQLTSGEIESIRVSSPAQARVAKIVSDIHKDRMDKRTVISGPSSEDLQQSMESLRRKETNVLQREYTKRLADESTVFRSGSLLESITGQIRKITASAADDAAVERSGRSLRTNLLTGIFVGTMIGQAANQILNGYSVPDLKYINGMGGEHYENKGGILGNENEVFLSPRPPRITPTGAAESRAMMSHSMMQDLALIESGIPPVQQYKSARRGAYVR